MMAASFLSAIADACYLADDPPSDHRWHWPGEDAPEPPDDPDTLSESSIIIADEPLGPPERDALADAEAWQRHYRTDSHRRRLAILLRDGGRCAYCGLDLVASPEALALATLDHVRPRAAGGASDHVNRVLACEPCNRLKGHFMGTLEECRTYLVERRRVYAERLRLIRPLLAARQRGESLVKLAACLPDETPRRGRLIAICGERDRQAIERAWLLRDASRFTVEASEQLVATGFAEGPHRGEGRSHA